MQKQIKRQETACTFSVHIEAKTCNTQQSNIQLPQINYFYVGICVPVKHKRIVRKSRYFLVFPYG